MTRFLALGVASSLTCIMGLGLVPAPEAVAGASPDSLRDDPAQLVDQLRYRNLEEMDVAHLRAATLPKEPWSGSYWPFYSGTIAFRYSDPSFPSGRSWKRDSRYLLSTLGKADPSDLSPAEKYDLLVGNPRWTLAREMISLGKSFYDSYGSVAGWMGICEGWAAASFMVPRPRHDVEVVAADGSTRLVFHPDDIKALASVLWAYGNYPYRFIGHACDDDAPFNRAMLPRRRTRCEGLDPASFHVALVNQIGVSGRSLVLDAGEGDEVWNQPVLSYRYAYFNPRTLKDAESLNEARVPVRESTDDADASRRSLKVRYRVGIHMEVDYMDETDPTGVSADSEEQDVVTPIRYDYLLELESTGRIVGGQWRSRAHPDFLWVPEKGTSALADGEKGLDPSTDATWDGENRIPASWKPLAAEAAEKGEPLSRVVETLVNLAQ